MSANGGAGPDRALTPAGPRIPTRSSTARCVDAPQRSVIDTSNFDAEFTEQKAEDSLAEGSELSASVQRKFEGFTFVADNNLKSYAATPQMGSSLLI